MKTKITLMISASLLSCTLLNAQIIDGGNNHSIRLCSGVVHTWGNGAYGEIGNGFNNNSNIPVSISSMSNVLAVEAHKNHNLVLKSDSTVWGWGNNMSGQLGTGTVNTPGINTPTQVVSLTSIKKLGSGDDHSFAIKANGDVWAWGGNSQGQLGLGNTTSTYVPTKITSLSGITDVDGGAFHTLFLKNDGTVWGCGNASGGVLGNGVSAGGFNTPVQVLGPNGVGFLTNIIAIAAGYNFSYALRNDGTVWSWGTNADGQLGNGNTTNTNVPIQATVLTGSFVAIDAGASFGIALKSDGTIWGWGSNTDGQLGNGSFVSTLIAVQATGITTGSAIAAGFGHSLAVLNNGTTWAWGRGANGQLGNGATLKSTVPVQVNVCGATGIEEYSKNSTISVFPNPSTGLFTLKLNTTDDSNIEIINMLGQTVYAEKVLGENPTINLQHLPNGMYSAKISKNGKALSTAKIIIQK